MNIRNRLFISIFILLAFCNGFGQDLEWTIISEVPSSMSRLYFTDSTHGWAIGGSGGIYTTEDGGLSWSPQNSGTEKTLECIHFLDEKTGLTCGYNKTLIRTNDKGRTWTQVEVESDTGLIYSSLCSDSGGNVYFISNYGGIYCSNNSGITWQNFHNFESYGFSYLDCSNNPICYAMPILMKSFFKSIDGGVTWTKMSTPVKYSADIFFLNDSTGWVSEDWALSSAWHDSTSIYMTLDGGETWVRQSTLQGLTVGNIQFLDTYEGWISTFDKICYSPDSGKSWICQFECDSTCHIKDIFFWDRQNGWALTSHGDVIRYGIPVEVSVDNEHNIIPDDYILHQNYPNPFNPATTIYFHLPKPGHTTIKIYNSAGQEVEILQLGFMDVGPHEVVWQPKHLSGGVYLIQMQSGKCTKTNKLIYLK